MANVQYLTNVVKNYLSGEAEHSCPYCHSTNSVVLGKKYLLVQLRKCQDCGLMFRYPKDQAADNTSYYQSDYEEGLTTAVPSETELKSFLENSFKGSCKDFSSHINLLKSYIPEGRILDYGCSWGYGVWQMQQAGYQATGFEISQPRAEFGRKNLGANILSQLGDLDKIPDESFELIFTSHVLEHLPDISHVFALFKRILTPSGILAIFVPDCDECDNPFGFKQKQSFAFGEKHTIAFDSKFLSQALIKTGFSVLKLENNPESAFPELVVIARK